MSYNPIKTYIILEDPLKHCGLWQDKRNRGPPVISIDEHLYFELEYVNCEEVLMDF